MMPTENPRLTAIARLFSHSAIARATPMQVVRQESKERRRIAVAVVLTRYAYPESSPVLFLARARLLFLHHRATTFERSLASFGDNDLRTARGAHIHFSKFVRHFQSSFYPWARFHS
jgi:hypothetical protein